MDDAGNFAVKINPSHSAKSEKFDITVKTGFSNQPGDFNGSNITGFYKDLGESKLTVRMNIMNHSPATHLPGTIFAEKGIVQFGFTLTQSSGKGDNLKY